MKTLVSLVSEQTIPNLQLIIEFKEKITEFWFFHSNKTKVHTKWIIDAARIDQQKVKLFEIDPFDLRSITNQLGDIDYKEQDFILNLTGGTKIWIMAFFEKFKDLGADIYYLTGRDCQYIKLFPKKGELLLKLTKSPTLDEYLIASGFKINGDSCKFDEKTADNVFEVFLKNDEEFYLPAKIELYTLRNKLSLKKKSSIEFNKLNNETKEFLSLLKFDNYEVLKKEHIKYLTGDWFEEWVYYKIHKEIELSINNSSISSTITKAGAENEMDVMFLYRQNLFCIECKTSILKLNENNELRGNILADTIYKADYLKNKLGLSSKSYIFTLSELKDENKKPYNNFEMAFKRAELSGIEIISKRNLLDYYEGKTSMKELLKIQ